MLNEKIHIKKSDVKKLNFKIKKINKLHPKTKK